MNIFHFFNKKHKKNNNISKMTDVTFPILPCITSGTPEKSHKDREEDFLSNYIKRIKNDEKIKELFPEILNKLEDDLPKEEKEELIEPIQKYEIKEARRRDVFYYLAQDYNKTINRKVEENYQTGKIEEFPLCKRIGSYEYEELKESYPEEMQYLENIYFPRYNEYMEESLHSVMTEFVFHDLTEFAKFIEKINYYAESRISDKCFNVVNDALNYYGQEMYGDNLSGSVVSYFFKYDNYLKVKSSIMSEIEILLDENMEDHEIKRDAVIKIKNKSGFYLSTRKGRYII